MGIHFNHKSKSGDRKMQKEYKLKLKAEERKRKREERAKLEQEEEMRKLEELTRPDKNQAKETWLVNFHQVYDERSPLFGDQYL